MRRFLTGVREYATLPYKVQRSGPPHGTLALLPVIRQKSAFQVRGLNRRAGESGNRGVKSPSPFPFIRD